MGKFDGRLLISDMDGTILNHEKKPLKISDENREAILYFQSEGGLFTFGTGRIPCSARPFMEGFSVNAPIVTFNGAAVYDMEKDEYLWTMPLPDTAMEAVRYVDAHFPNSGIEIYRAERAYHCKQNMRTVEQFRDEQIPPIEAKPEEVPLPWMKVLFAQECEETVLLRSAMEKNRFFEEYTLTQSGPLYYEILNKKANKGVALLKLCALLGISPRDVIAVGDGLNDKEMLACAGVGIAPQGSVPEALAAADKICVPCRDHVLFDIVYHLEG